MKVTLSITADGAPKRELVFDRPGHYVIGRMQTAEIRVDDPRVSKRHALLVVDKISARIQELGSANGTVVDGVPLGNSSAHAAMDLPPPPKWETPPPEMMPLDGVREPTISLEIDQVRKRANAVEAVLREGSVIEVGGTSMRVKLEFVTTSPSPAPELLLRGKEKLAEAEKLFEEATRADPSDRRAKAAVDCIEKIKIIIGA